MTSAHKPPLPGKATKNSSNQSRAIIAMTSNSSFYSSSPLTNKGKRSLISRLHSFQKQQNIQKKEVTERI
jgi:hypothetical protein